MQDRVHLRVRMCPHVVYMINTLEEWGAAHRYDLRGRCDVCGPIRQVEFRPAYAG